MQKPLIQLNIFTTFQIVRPVLATHCKICDRCYDQIDHHCLYLYRCIAIATHRVFVIFNLLVMVVMVIFVYACIVYLRLEFPTDPYSWVTVGYVFSYYPVAWSLFIINAGSLLWGFWLMKVQLNVISKGGGIASYKSHMFKSRLTIKQRLLNVIYFLLKKEPYALDVFSA